MICKQHDATPILVQPEDKNRTIIAADFTEHPQLQG